MASFELSQEHLDMLNLMKAETVAILSNGDHSPHNDNVRRFSNVFDIIAGIAGSIINMQAAEKQAKQIARGEIAAPAPVVVAPPPPPVVEAPPAPVVAVERAPLTLEPPAPPPAPAPAPPPAPPAPIYNFGPAV